MAQLLRLPWEKAAATAAAAGKVAAPSSVGASTGGRTGWPLINNSPSRRRPEPGLIIGGQVAPQPFGRNGLVRAFGQCFAIRDAARGSKLDREAGIVLVVNDPLAGSLTRRLADPNPAEDEVAELMDLVPVYAALLDRVQQFGLIVFDHAFPVVDDPGPCPLMGPSVDFRALVGDV